MVIVVKPW